MYYLGKYSEGDRQIKAGSFEEQLQFVKILYKVSNELPQILHADLHPPIG